MVWAGDWDVPQEVPETRLGNDLVGRKYTHTVDFGGGLMLAGQVAAEDLVLRERHLQTRASTHEYIQR